MTQTEQKQIKKKASRSKIVIIILVLVLAAVWGAIAYVYFEQQRAKQARLEELANAPVPTLTLTRGDLAETVDDLTGTLRSKQSISLYWKAAGTVDTVNVELGDKVEKGDVLASLATGTIQSSIIEAAVTKEKKEKELENLITSDLALATAYNKMIQAKKAIDTAKTTINSLGLARNNTTELNAYYQDYLDAQAFYEEAAASFEQLKDRPLDDFDRQMAVGMLESAKSSVSSAESTYNWYNGEVDPLELKKAEATLQLREAEYRDAVRAYEEIKNGPTENQINALQAEINAAAATVRTAEIIAPISGVITEVNAAPLDVIQANSAGIVVETLAIRMDDLSAYYVDVDIHESKINDVQIGQTVELTFDAVPLVEYSGKISNISIVGKVTNNVVHFPVTVKLDQVSPELKPGMVANLKIYTKEYKDVLTVPVAAIGTNENGESVIAVQDSDGSFRDLAVTVGYSNGVKSEISADGLEEGMIIRESYISGPFGMNAAGLLAEPLGGIFGGSGN